MPIAVREANLDRDRELIVHSLTRYLSLQVDRRRYNWLYCESPFGPARAWLIESGNEVIGAAGAFPRTLLLNGQQRTGIVLGDFCLKPEYRSLGPALQLQRACLAAALDRQVALCYDFPSQSMMAIYGRLGIAASTYTRRLARPLAVDRQVEARLGSGTAARVVSRMGNAVLRRLEARPSTDCEFSLHSGAFAEEFTELACELGRTFDCCTFRSAAYLNWRYRTHPNQAYTAITARTKGQLLGYVVFCCHGSAATIADLVYPGESELLQGLAASAAEYARSAGMTTINLPLLETSSWIPSLRQIGFHVRESSPVITLYANGNSVSPLGLLLLPGDRES